jgi:hypothetical protein
VTDNTLSWGETLAHWEVVMAAGETKVHDKDRALFDRIDATLAAYDATCAEATPTYLRPYADELDSWQLLRESAPGHVTQRSA